LVTILIFAAMSTVLFELYKAGKTSIYQPITAYPLWYLPLSFFLCAFIHDTYFYWSHRLMHWQAVFKYVHLAHHRSIAPTPWAIFAFNPLEAVIQFIGIMLLVLFLPLHPVVLLAFLSYDTVVNAAGHTGFEMMPKGSTKHWPFKFFNTVTHHDNHHTNMRVNFGAFFTFWDRLMGTYLDNAEVASSARPAGMVHHGTVTARAIDNFRQRPAV
jgi:lathosterol oxidase